MSNSTCDHQDNLLDSLLGDFLDESDQLLAQLNDNLLQLDESVQSLDEGRQGRCEERLLNEMFRAAHSLKGLSAMLGLTDINHLTHKIENVFDAARKDELRITAEVTELMFMGLDQLVALIESLKQPDAEPVDCDAVIQAIAHLLRSTGVERRQTSQADAERALDSARDEPTGGAPLSPDGSNAAPEPNPLDGIHDEADIPDSYISIFVDEAEEGLDELTSALLAAEDGAGGDALQGLLATVHKIKGSAASVGLNRATKLTHLMEDLLENSIESSTPLSAAVLDLLLKCTACLQQYLGDLKHGGDSSDRFVPLARELRLLQPGSIDRCDNAQDSHAARMRVAGPGCHALPGARSLSERLSGVVEEIRDRLQGVDLREIASLTGMAASTVRRVQDSENIKLASLLKLAAHFDEAESPGHFPNCCYVGEVTLQADLPSAGLKAQLIYEKLMKVGDVCDCQPSPETFGEIMHLDCLRFRITTDQSPEAISDLLHVGGVREAHVAPLDDHPAASLSVGHPADPQDDNVWPGSNGLPAVAVSGQEETGPPGWEPAGVEGPEGISESKELPVEVRSDAEQGPASPPASEAGATEAEAASRSNPAARRPPAEAKSGPPDASQRPTETVRVDIERLDQLMDLAGQLVTNRAQFAQIGDKLSGLVRCKQSVHALNKISAELGKLSEKNPFRLDGQHAAAQELLGNRVQRIQHDLEPLRREVQSLSEARDFVRELFEAVHQLERLSNGIQQGVMDTRMVPIGPLFARFKRVVRDITRASRKQIRLDIRGEKTELDKRMIDELGDPLVHMVRNSADHGIESPEQREAAGKPPQGTVTLDAFHRGNSIVIQVRDDGKGLDTDRVLAKCLERGLLSEADAEKMTPHQIHQMIWEPGLSTADKVTDISGRGMGMDIVKSKIEELSGTIDIESSPGVGTTITVKLPLTLAILPSLMVDIGGDVFAMPMEAVIEIVSIDQDEMSTVNGRQIATVRGRAISLIRLAETLSFHRSGQGAEAGTSRKTTLVVISQGGQEIGLTVDDVIGEENVVIKSIAENYKNIPGIAGASILGDGRVSLILDTVALIEMMAKRTAC